MACSLACPGVITRACGERQWNHGNLARMDRDLIGYGGNPPDPKWPGGARLALNFVLNYEEGSEPSVPDGDPASEWRPDGLRNF